MNTPRTPISLGRSLVLAAITAAALALPPAALAGGFTAHLIIATHQPKVGRQPITVTATRGAQKLSGSVYYRFLYDGILLPDNKPGGSFTHGVYHDTLLWPKKAVGHTVTLQVVVRTRYGTDYLNWWIKVRA